MVASYSIVICSNIVAVLQYSNHIIIWLFHILIYSRIYGAKIKLLSFIKNEKLLLEIFEQKVQGFQGNQWWKYFFSENTLHLKSTNQNESKQILFPPWSHHMICINIDIIFTFLVFKTFNFSIFNLLVVFFFYCVSLSRFQTYIRNTKIRK